MLCKNCKLIEMRVDTIKNDMATHICRKCGYTVTEPIPQPAKKSDKNNKD